MPNPSHENAFITHASINLLIFLIKSFNFSPDKSVTAVDVTLLHPLPRLLHQTHSRAPQLAASGCAPHPPIPQGLKFLNPFLGVFQ